MPGLPNRVSPLAVFALEGIHLQARLLDQTPADEIAHAMRLPAGSLHDLGQGGPIGLFKQGNDDGFAAAFAGNGGLGFNGGILLGGGLRRRRVGRLWRNGCAQSLNGCPDAADGCLPAAELLHRLLAGEAVPDLNQPVGGPIGGELVQFLNGLELLDGFGVFDILGLSKAEMLFSWSIVKIIVSLWCGVLCNDHIHHSVSAIARRKEGNHGRRGKRAGNESETEPDIPRQEQYIVALLE